MFTLYRTGERDNRIQMFLVALMQLTAALATEYVNMVELSKSEGYQAIISNVLIFGFLTTIDDLFAQAWRNTFAGALQKYGKLRFSKLEGEDLEVNRSRFSKLGIGIYLGLKCFYESFYFYFMSYVTLLISY